MYSSLKSYELGFINVASTLHPFGNFELVNIRYLYRRMAYIKSNLIHTEPISFS